MIKSSSETKVYMSGSGTLNQISKKKKKKGRSAVFCTDVNKISFNLLCNEA